LVEINTVTATGDTGRAVDAMAARLRQRRQEARHRAEDAETIRTECGSIGALAQELARRDIVSKARTFSSGRTRGGGRYGVGARAHFLKNRFYISEVVYRGEIHAGEHEPIL
jgi:hypothetical protein